MTLMALRQEIRGQSTFLAEFGVRAHFFARSREHIFSTANLVSPLLARRVSHAWGGLLTRDHCSEKCSDPEFCLKWGLTPKFGNKKSPGGTGARALLYIYVAQLRISSARFRLNAASEPTAPDSRYRLT